MNLNLPVIYPLLDPSMEEGLLLNKLEQMAGEDIAAIQVWDNFRPGTDIPDLLRKICSVCQRHAVPVLINNRWELLALTDLSGVHFDELPADLPAIRASIDRLFLTGVTCGNDLGAVRAAAEQQVDYISFCSIFPSCTSNSCELVRFDTVREARRLTAIPLFLAGGIRPDNIHELQDLPFDGLAVVSGILQSARPAAAIREYYEQLQKLQHDT